MGPNLTRRPMTTARSGTRLRSHQSPAAPRIATSALRLMDSPRKHVRALCRGHQHAFGPAHRSLAGSPCRATARLHATGGQSLGGEAVRVENPASASAPIDMAPAISAATSIPGLGEDTAKNTRAAGIDRTVA